MLPLITSILGFKNKFTNKFVMIFLNFFVSQAFKLLVIKQKTHVRVQNVLNLIKDLIRIELCTWA